MNLFYLKLPPPTTILLTENKLLEAINIYVYNKISLQIVWCSSIQNIICHYDLSSNLIAILQ